MFHVEFSIGPVKMRVLPAIRSISYSSAAT
jgi:hypothetical protein